MSQPSPGRRRRRRQPRRPLPYTPARDGRPFWQRIAAPGWVLLGLLLGLGIGLYYTWIIDPVVYVQAGPARLSQQYKAEYIFLVSQSFAADGNWPRAQQRLAALEDPNLPQTVNTLLETYVRDLQSPEALRHMANLAQQVGAEGGAVAIFAPTPPVLPTPTLAAQVAPTQDVPATLTPTSTLPPSPTPPPSPTIPPPATKELAYRLVNQEPVCNQGDDPLIEVIVQDAAAGPLPGVEVLVTWSEGEDRFFTGFKPDEGAGYADFTLSPEVSYTVALAAGSEEVSGLRLQSCAAGTEGGWRLIFQRLTTVPNPSRDN